MWSDNETNSDLIDYQHLVGAVTGIINNDNLLPCSIGIFGDWGSGKSSLMRMIEQKYEDDKDVLIINFNGWLFEGYEDTKTVLMGRIVDEIIKKRTLEEKAIKIAAKLLRKIDFIKLGRSAVSHGLGFLTMGPVGLVAASSTDIVKNLAEADYEKFIRAKQKKEDPDETLRTNIQEFHLNFEELINETKIKKILVLIDDLDRCSHDTVIGTLEAIKLFLFAKNTAFIIGADERLIKYAVRRRFPEIPGDNTEVGRDYLEKLIQYPIRIPPLSGLELTTYVNLLFSNLHIDVGEFEYVRNEVLRKKGEDQFGFSFGFDNASSFINTVSEELKEALLLSAQLVPVLTAGLNGNPRQTKRFLNTMLLRQEMAKSKGEKLDKKILAKLMLLEYFKAETFKSYYQMQAENKGVIAEMEIMEKLTAGNIEEPDILSVEQLAYLQDPWLKNWYSSEPSLKGIDLQSYFYYSRDKLSVSGIKQQRISSPAQEVLRKLLSNTETIQNSGLKDATSLSPGDSSAIFEVLMEKVLQEGKQEGDLPTIKRTVDFCGVRKELISQLMVAVEKLPHQILPPGIITWLMDVTEDTDHSPTAKKIIGEWAKSLKNKPLATIAKNKIK